MAGLDHEVVTRVQCGASHSLAVTANGKLYCWGKNSVGQCGKGEYATDVIISFDCALPRCVCLSSAGTMDDILRPTLVSSLQLERIVQVSIYIPIMNKGTVII